MVVSVQAEDEVQACFGQMVQQRAGAQVGLLVGRQGVGSRDLLLGLIKTPPTQEGQEPLQTTGSSDAAAHASTPSGSSKSGKKKGGGAGAAPSTQAPSSQLTLDVDWVAEHAAQVSRMLPGGLLILGLYIFCTESGYQSVLAQLCAALTAMIAAQNIYPAGEAVPASPLLLFADAASRKVTFRSLDVPQGSTASPSQLKMADLKFAPSASSLVCLRCSHTLDMALPAPSSCDQLQHQLETLVEEACQAIRCSVAVVADSTQSNGTSSPITIPPESAPLTDCIPPPTTTNTTNTTNSNTHSNSTTTNSNTHGHTHSNSNSNSNTQPQQHSQSTPLTSPLTQLMPSIPILPVTLFTPVGISNTVSVSEGAGSGISPGSEGPQDSAGKNGKDRHARNGQSTWASLVEMVQSVGGQAGLQGAVQGVAYCHKRESFGRSVLALKADLMASLRARVDLVLEDAMASWDAQQQQQQCHQGKSKESQQQQCGPQHPLLRSGAAALTKPVALPLPQRVLLPWPGHRLALCDYLLPGEGPEATVERAQELLAPPLPPSSYPGPGDVLVLEPACPSLSAKQLSPWNPHDPSSTLPHTVPATPVPPPSCATSQSSSPFSAHAAAVRRACAGGAVVAAAGVAALGVVLGYMLYGQQ